jgi:hypothetical protein
VYSSSVSKNSASEIWPSSTQSSPSRGQT